jgi:hypothetical protein
MFILWVFVLISVCLLSYLVYYFFLLCFGEWWFFFGSQLWVLGKFLKVEIKMRFCIGFSITGSADQ